MTSEQAQEKVFKIKAVLAKLAAEMALKKGMPSPHLDDWSLPKSLSKRVRRQIVEGAQKAEDQCNNWSRRVREIYDHI